MATVKGGLTGDKALLKELKRLEKAAPGAVSRALYQQGVMVLGDAIRRAPVETGVLRSSGYVAPPQEEGGSTVVEVGFGTVYAEVQHEREDFEHPQGGEAKYLEKAVASQASAQRVAALAKENLARGLTTPVLPGAPPKKPKVRASVRKRALARKRKAAARKKAREQRRKEKRQRRRKKP
jgi:hypothetical protein